MNQKSRQRTKQPRRFVPVINGEGLQSQLPLDQIRGSGKFTVCHGRTADGKTVNSPAYHRSGNSTVIGVDQNFNQALSLSNPDMELLSMTWLKERGFTITPPGAAQA